MSSKIKREITPIDPLIQHLLSNDPYGKSNPTSKANYAKLWEALKKLSDHLLRKDAIQPSQIDITELTSLVGTEIQVNGTKLEPIVNFNDLIPAAPDEDHQSVAWQLILSGGKYYVSAYVPNREDIPYFGSTLFGVSGVAIAASADFPPYVGGASTNDFPVPVGGWLRNPVTLLDSAQVDAAMLIGIKDNGNYNGTIKTVIPPLGAAGVYSTRRGSIRLEEANPFRFSAALVGSVGSSMRSHVIEYATDDGSCVIGWQGSKQVLPATTTYFAPFTGATFDGAVNEGRAEIKCRFAGTVQKVLIRTNGTQPGTGSLVMTVRKNGAATALVKTIAAGDLAGLFANSTNTFTVVDGDRITFEFTNNAPANNSAFVLSVAVCILPTNPGTTSLLGMNWNTGGTPFNSGTTLYIGLFSSTLSTSATNHRTPLPRAGILNSFSVHVGSGALSPSVTFTIVKGTRQPDGTYVEADTAMTATYPREAAEGWIDFTGGPVTYAARDYLFIKGVTEVYGTSTRASGMSGEYAAEA